MRHRIQVSFHAGSASSTPAAILHANNHHDRVDLKELVQDVVAKKRLLSPILGALLAKKYPSNSGAHKKGDPIFWLDFSPGDAEEHFAILSSDDEGLVHRGYVAGKGASLKNVPVIRGR